MWARTDAFVTVVRTKMTENANENGDFQKMVSKLKTFKKT